MDTTPFKVLVISTILLLSLLGCTDNAASIEGWYLNKHVVYSTILATEATGRITVNLVGGHVGNGPATMIANDCEIEARGTLDGDLLKAFYLNEGEENKAVRIRFAEGSLEVLGADVSDYCGMHTRFYGKYEKMTPKEIGDIFKAEGMEIPERIRKALE